MPRFRGKQNAMEIVEFRFSDRAPSSRLNGASLFGGLRAGGREAGGGDGDDLGQPAPDPGRCAAQQ
jgi:hypothetical protein